MYLQGEIFIEVFKTIPRLELGERYSWNSRLYTSSAVTYRESCLIGFVKTILRIGC